MGNTANNNWPYPESTDLVKDGATAIENLADAIDTTLGVFVPSSPGLTLINTTSFSGVSSQSFNDVFSATYDNYLMVCNFDQNTSAGSLEIRMRAAGTNRTGAAYNFTTLEWATSATVARLASQTAYLVGSAFATVEHNFTALFTEPFVATRASGIYCEINRNTTGSSVGSIVSGAYTTNDSNDGFAFLVSAGTITGTVSVYGYNK
jgi:hypothetical protein